MLTVMRCAVVVSAAMLSGCGKEPPAPCSCLLPTHSTALPWPLQAEPAPLPA